MNASIEYGRVYVGAGESTPVLRMLPACGLDREDHVAVPAENRQQAGPQDLVRLGGDCASHRCRHRSVKHRSRLSSENPGKAARRCDIVGKTKGRPPRRHPGILQKLAMNRVKKTVA